MVASFSTVCGICKHNLCIIMNITKTNEDFALTHIAVAQIFISTKTVLVQNIVGLNFC